MTEKDAATLSRLVTGCREQMEGELVELVEELGPSLLQEIAARTFPAREPERRIAAATLKLALGAHWGKVAPALKTALASRTVVPAQPGLESRDIANLKLLSDAEESILIASNEALDRLTTACRDETNPLERRVSYLVLRSAMQPGDASFRLATLWPCLQAAFCEITPDTGARILLLKTVGERLATEMPQLFRVVNEALIDADILPRLKRSYRDTTPVDAHEVAAETAKVATTLDRLVKARTKEEESTGKPGSGAGSQTLFSSLKTLQAAPAPATPGTHANVVRMARDSGAARDVRPQDAVTLDIVAELFDLIFNDPNIANGMKGLVARLQSTVLKAAMLNQRFFADRSHPARRFLDSISTVAIRWGKAVNADDPFFVKLLELVNRIQLTYDGDMAVFDAANTELDAFLAEREKIEEQQDRELAEAVHAREEEIRLTRAAQMRAQRTANQCIARVLGPAVPGEIEEFLRSYWRDVVQGRISRSGEDGAPTGEAHSFGLSVIADVVRLRNFTVLELGGDVGPEAFVDAASRADRLVAVGIGVTGAEHVPAAWTVVEALRRARPGVPVLVGGQAVANAEVAELSGADGWAPDARSLADLVEARVPARTPTRTRARPTVGGVVRPRRS